MAGQTVTITQEAGNNAQNCTYAVAPLALNVAAAGASETVTVTAGAGCSWTAASSVPWISLASGTSGSANGSCRVVDRRQYRSVSHRRDHDRRPDGDGHSSGGRSLLVCVERHQPDARPRGRGRGSVTGYRRPAAAWTAVSSAPWITVTSGGEGSRRGGGDLQRRRQYRPVSHRHDDDRRADVAPSCRMQPCCTYSIAPTVGTSVPAAGTGAAISVSTESRCDWMAVSNDSWIAVTSGGVGQPATAR